MSDDGDAANVIDLETRRYATRQLVAGDEAAPAPMLRLELKLHAENCSVDFYVIDAEDNLRAVIPMHPDVSVPDVDLNLLRTQWPRWREESAVAS
jgi:hypothetical protein